MYILRPLLFSLFLCLCGLTNLQAQTPAAAEPSDVADLLRLLEDDNVRVWLEQKQAAVSESRDNEAAWFIEEWEVRSRARFNALLAAVPRVGDELSRVVSAVRQEAQGSGVMRAALMFAIIAGIAFGTEWIFRRSVPALSILKSPLSQTYTEFLTLSIFTATVAILFFLFAWPPLMRVVVLYSLVAFIACSLATALCRIALAASIISARSYSRIRIFIALLAATMAFSAISERLAVAADVRSALAIGLSIPFVVIAIVMIWRECSSDVRSLQGRISRAIGISGAIVLWLLWCGDFLALFWLGIMLVLVPRALSIADSLMLSFSPTRSCGRDLLDPKAVLLVRGTRAIILISAVDWVTRRCNWIRVADLGQGRRQRHFLCWTLPSESENTSKQETIPASWNPSAFVPFGCGTTVGQSSPYLLVRLARSRMPAAIGLSTSSASVSLSKPMLIKSASSSRRSARNCRPIRNSVPSLSSRSSSRASSKSVNMESNSVSPSPASPANRQ